MNRLNENTVKLISSGQVVTSVSNVIKELIENSLDAKATTIEVKLANYGLDLIEVKDNGIGVASEDIESMVKNHHTSKIKEFEDISHLDSYGFRGEALSSLCSYVECLEVVSKRDQDKMAKCARFDNNGRKVKVNCIKARLLNNHVFTTGLKFSII